MHVGSIGWLPPTNLLRFPPGRTKCASSGSCLRFCVLGLSAALVGLWLQFGVDCGCGEVRDGYSSPVQRSRGVESGCVFSAWIRKPKKNPQPPTTKEKVTRLKVAMQQQLRKEPSSEKFEDLYKVAYMLVLHKHGLKLYDGFRNVVTEHVDKMRDDVEGASPAAFLSTMHQAYTDFTTSLVAIRDLLMYMDRVYVPQQSDQEHVERMGLMLFCDRVLHHGTVRQKLQSAIFDTIALERSGQAVERSKLKNICEMLMQLGLGSRHVYEDIFETPYLQQLSELEAQHQHGQISNPFLHAQQMKERLALETERAANCFDNSTELRIHAIFGRYATNGPTS